MFNGYTILIKLSSNIIVVRFIIEVVLPFLNLYFCNIIKITRQIFFKNCI